MNKFNVFLMSVLMLVICTASAQAYTAQEIVNSVVQELDKVNDYQASVNIDYTLGGGSDMTGGTLLWKCTSSLYKVDMLSGTPYNLRWKSDGTGWNEAANGTLSYYEQTVGEEIIHASFGTDMFNMKKILQSQTWSKDPGTFTVNGVECYKVYTNNNDKNYQVWIDTSTRTKVIRVINGYYANNPLWRLDYEDYVSVESTVLLPQTITTTHYDYNHSTVDMVAEYSFSNININENISDSIFTIEKS